MAVNYTIQADVVDIGADTPIATDAFLVDTNVWFWMTYPTAGQSAIPYQLTSYPSYVNSALGNGVKICRTGLSLAELSHRIEKTEHDIYRSYVNAIELKEYRHNIPAERSRIVSEVEAAWGQVKSLAEPLAVTVDDPTTDAALARFQTEKVDGYDLFILETMKSNGVLQVITDDGDFATVAGIEVFTANRNVISSARAQGKLLTR
jgi:predicted nucleic acid-binding protein